MLNLPANSLAFTFCQVPVIYNLDQEEKIQITFADSRILEVPGSILDREVSAHIFQRSGFIQQLSVYVRMENQ